MMSQHKEHRIKGFIQAFMAGLLWGACSPIAQYLFDYKGITSEWLVPYRLLAAGILLLIYAKIKRMNLTELFKEKQDVARLIVFSVVGMMGMQYAFFAMVQETNAGMATIFQYLNPAMLIVYFAFAYKIAPKKKEILAVICSVTGIFLVATHGDVTALSISPAGLFWGITVALTTCFYGVLPVPLLNKFQAEVVCAWSMIIGAVVLAVITKPWQIEATVDIEVAAAFFAIVFLGTIFPFCFYLSALKNIGSVYTSLLSSVEPVAAAVLAAACLGTAFQRIDIAGYLLVLSTMFILNINPKK